MSYTTSGNLRPFPLKDFRVSIPRLPDVNFLTQRVTIPGVQGGSVVVPNPFNPTKQTGTLLTYSPLSLDFMVQADLKSYEEVYAWLVQANFPQTSNQFSRENLTHDISVELLGPKLNFIKRFVFKNAFPVSLSDISLDTAQTDITFLKATVSFEYDYFNIEDN